MQSVSPHSPIGVFDSGIGGLSILKALRTELPRESFVYFADTAHNPYGEKSEAFVIERSRAITQQLIAQHRIKALVVACNTATAAAIHLLRAEHPGLPIIGVEPALKPAVATSTTKRIAVLATRGTLHSAKFQALLQALQGQAEFICTPCDGLAELIERDADTQVTINLIAAYASFIGARVPFGTKNKGIDTLVLGCTHYPLVLPLFRQVVGDSVQIIDNGPAVARRTVQLVSAAATAQPPHATLVLESSAAGDSLQRAAQRWLQWIPCSK